MQETVSIRCEPFKKNPDGSWSSVQPADIRTARGDIRIPPGMIFFQIKPIWGVDVATYLEENCN
ncbi:MAG: hypothetical protein JSU58_09025 [Dehalococcoidales bacterium]|nr:MAG: hypothetical protein JSU58_09025 [Dehalococcoidales bacterium]